MKLLVSIIALALTINANAISHQYHEQFQQDSLWKIFSSQTTFPLTGNNSIAGVPRNTIYITIDDGPTGKATPEMLRILKKHNVLATFFVIGKNVENYPSIVRQAYNDGHVIANHTYEHLMDYPNSTSFQNSLMKTHNLIKPYLDNSRYLLFRAPGGVWNNWRASVGNSHSVLRDYIGPFYWNVGGGNPKNNNDADWKCWSKGVSVRSCSQSYLSQINNNYTRGTASLVLLHDVNIKSAELLDIILTNLKQSNIRWDFRLLEDIPAVQNMDR
jgi:peptidoglycan/xylan/chitin deacetylase (PgdA/CDA1 family)